MKRTALALFLILLLASCDTKPKTVVQRKVDSYALVKIESPDLSGITDNGKEVLNLYKFAADQVDSIYWKQYFGDKTLIENLKDVDLRDYALINYGPWDRLDGSAFISGFGELPLGANFYPKDMTAAEFDSLADPVKTSPYSIIRRGKDGKLTSVWYHDAYKYNIDKICNYLKAAADITIKPSVRNYLLKKIDALRTDYYYDSDLAWLEMTDSKMDLIIGPDEINDDQLYGLKASYEAYVLLKDLKRTEVLDQFKSMLPEFQRLIPCEDQYKTFVPGGESEIYAYDAIYCSGHANAGIKLIALNLPYNEDVQAKAGTRTAILRNIMSEKFNRIVNPVGIVVLTPDQQDHLSEEAFYWNIVFREISHGLGVKETVNGKGEVDEALGNKALTWEDAKANALGLYLVCRLLDDHRIPTLVTKEDAITTFVANLIRSERFGEASQLGRAYVMLFNYLNQNGAFKRGDSGKYSIDYEKTLSLVAEFTAIAIKTQATGDHEFAERFETQYCVMSEDFKADLMNIRLENIPIDLRFEFQK